MKKYLITLGLLFLSTSSHSQVRSKKPDSWHMHFFGYRGLINLGLGYDVSQWFKSGFSLGFTPQDNGDNRFQLNFSHEFHAPPKNSLVSPFAGFTVLYGLGSDLFIELPEEYPSGYYPPSALRASLDLGLKIFAGISNHLIIQYSILDSEIAPLANSYQSIGDIDFGSWLLGWELKLD